MFRNFRPKASLQKEMGTYTTLQVIFMLYNDANGSKAGNTTTLLINHKKV